MILISAVPLNVGVGYDPRNEYFINPDRIKTAVYNDHVYTHTRGEVNVTLDDKTQWIIAREVFDSMRLFYTPKEN